MEGRKYIRSEAAYWRTLQALLAAIIDEIVVGRVSCTAWSQLKGLMSNSARNLYFL